MQKPLSMERFAHSTNEDGTIHNLVFHRGNYPCFLAFDLLMRDGKDCRRENLMDRKQELRRLLSGSDARIQYVDYVDGEGMPLFDQICKHDLEGIVAKQKHAHCVTDREATTWFKVRNPCYSQCTYFRIIV